MKKTKDMRSKTGKAPCGMQLEAKTRENMLKNFEWFQYWYLTSATFQLKVRAFMRSKGWGPDVETHVDEEVPDTKAQPDGKISIDAEAVAKLVRDLTRLSMQGLPPMPPRQEMPKVHRLPESAMPDIQRDLETYGNSFYSEMPEFSRKAVCSKCGSHNTMLSYGAQLPGQYSLAREQRTEIRAKVGDDYDLVNQGGTGLQVVAKCNCCRHRGPMAVEDSSWPGSAVWHHRWDPTRMHGQANPFYPNEPGKVSYFYEIPDEDRARLKANDQEFIDRMPWAYLQACASKEKLFRFATGKVIHLTRG